MTHLRPRDLLLSGAALCLTACGGGGGSGIASTPPAPVTTPPPPASDKPLPPPHIGLVSAVPFAVLGMTDSYSVDASGANFTPLSGPSPANVQFSYDPATDSYSITLPNFQAGSLSVIGYGGSAGQIATDTGTRVTLGASTTLQPVFVTLPVPGSAFTPYTYTSLGYWSGQTSVTQTGQNTSEGIFAYGIPTTIGDVPITGSASYAANIFAGTGPPNPAPDVRGTVSLLFNFGAGTLSGSMHPVLQGWEGTVDFGQFDFKNTVYASGSTTFSGQFVVPNLPNAVSSFNGNFTGPGAAELMAQFQTPYILGGTQGTLSGIWIGKKN